jgi:glycosyltransferase involved in cell wall biosynthesis
MQNDPPDVQDFLNDRRLLQVFNRYLERGGEETWVETLERTLPLETCYFDSADWIGPEAPPIWSQPFRMIHNDCSLKKLREYQRRLNPHAWLLHNLLPVGSAAIYPEALRRNIPIIQYIHNFRPFSVTGYLQGGDVAKIDSWPGIYLREIARGSWRESRLKTAWLAMVFSLIHSRGCFKSVKAWIAPSDFMRDQFIRAGVTPAKIFTLRHFWRPSADPDSVETGEHYLFMGRLVEMKGVFVLLDAWDELFRQKGKIGPKLVIIGDGPLTETVRARAAKNPLVIFHGTISGEEKHDLLRRARAVIAPSLCFESLGLVTYEAYDFAKPMLAARAGGLGETVTHKVTGLLHAPGDSAQLFHDVMAFEEDANARIEMGRNGREWLLDNTNETEWKNRFAQIVDFATSKV